jgi:alternate signal-mediated exported protein
MNKFTKASIATGAGIVLLLGGAGTFAYWNDAETLAPGEITSGVLTIDQATTGAGTWTDTKGTLATTDDVAIGTIGDFRIVPGDKLIYTKSLVVTATGDNLLAKLKADLDGITGGDLDNDVTVTVEAVTAGSGVVNASDGSVHITAATAGSSTIAVQVVVSYPFGSAQNLAGQNESINLAGLKLVLEQVSSFI